MKRLKDGGPGRLCKLFQPTKIAGTRGGAGLLMWTVIVLVLLVVAGLAFLVLLVRRSAERAHRSEVNALREHVRRLPKPCCPRCDSPEKVVPIFYGLIRPGDPVVEVPEVELGLCVVRPENWCCRSCQHRFASDLHAYFRPLES